MPDVKEMHRKLVEILKNGARETDEGNEDGRNSLGSGVVREYKTYPENNSLSVTLDEDDGNGTIQFPFSCRLRKHHYELHVHTGSDDEQHPGTVTATYKFTMDGSLSIDSRNTATSGGAGRCGNSLVNFINSLNGMKLV